MKKILFLALLYLPIFVQSQNWFPNGATWYYNYQEQFAFPANGYTKYTVIKDTIIISRPAKLIKRETIRYNGNIILDDSLFVREDSSKVYYYKNNSFKLMYDFTLNVGDTLYINLNSSACDSVSPLVIDSIKTININGTNLRVQYVKCVYYYSGVWQGLIDTITYKIIERIGDDQVCSSCTNFIFDPVCDNWEYFTWTGLRCYQDYSILYKSGNYPYPCDTLIDGSTGISNFSIEENIIEIFPNPSTNNITIECSPQSTIQVSTIHGQLIKTLITTGTKTNVDVSSFQNGVYIVEVKTEKGIAVKKFVKE